MSCTPDQLRDAMNGYSGGSEERYRHTFNRKFIYTEGMKASAEIAGAYWLIDLIALKMAPIYAKAWLEGTAGTGIVTLTVNAREPAPATMTVGAVLAFKEGTAPRPDASVTLSLEDDTPLAFSEDISFTDFPVGEWTFYLGTDEAGPDDYITNCMVPPEY